VNSVVVSTRTLPDTTLPSVPTNVTVVGGAQTLGMTWTASSDTGGSGLAGYKVDVSTVSSFTSYVPGWQNRDVGLVVSTTATGLVPSTVYYVRVRALDGAGNASESSAVVSGETLGDTVSPSVPTNVTAVGGAQTLGMTWTASSDTGGSGLAGYRVDLSTVSTFASFVAGWENKDVGVQVSTAVTGLMASKVYYVRVRALDGAGNASGNSVVVSGETLGDTVSPSVPTNVTAVGGAQTLGMTWTASSDTGGSGLAGYKMDVSTVSSFTSYVPRWQNRDVGLVVSTTATGLVPSTVYYVRVRAYDGEGNVSESSAVMSTTTLADTLAPSVPVPTPLIRDEQAAFSWTESLDAGGSGLAGYRVDVSHDPNFSTFLEGWSGRDVGLVNSVTIPGLVPNTLYYARVRAYDGAGNGSINSVPVTLTWTVEAAENVASVRGYPSPFRPGMGALGITFDRLPAQASVRLYTMNGLLVKTLEAGGRSEVLWDISNDDGSSVASGVYLAVIESNGERRVMKVMVIK